MKKDEKRGRILLHRTGQSIIECNPEEDAINAIKRQNVKNTPFLFPHYSYY
jgi:hypothetical protein